ncbi:MAG: isoprenyl transferase [Gemmatimonadetes bacterium]|nr:isoprenyl transferase [Gemmatimonadota bacterium]
MEAAGNLPRHVAIIMDGNGRWAKRRSLPRLAGHRAAIETVREVVRSAAEIGVEVLTLYAFSTENWNRPAAEVNGLMQVLKDTLRREQEELNENGVRLATLGREGDLPADVRRQIDVTRRALAHNDRMLLNLALSYGGRPEIVDAARALVDDVAAGRISADEIDEDAFAARLTTAGLPDPDLLIRTSGEMRVSNFLLWQIAYAEIWVTDVSWPEFRRVHLYEGLREYQRRDRRFGRTESFKDKVGRIAAQLGGKK